MADIKKILIVEDEKPLASALVLKFNGSGFDAKAAYNGQEALDMLEKEKFDVVLLDLIMPVVDGFKVLEALKKKGDKTKVIVTSNLSQQEDVTKARGLGALDYIVKSDTPLSSIVDKVKNVLT